MKSLQKAIEIFARSAPESRRYLVGVSGGLDSTALLDLLFERGYRNLVVCHLNHGLRGRESGQDAALVRRFCGKLGIPVEIGKTDVLRISKSSNSSIEEAGRKARHRFFAQVAKIWRCRRVVLAHHADDQVETVLINLGRGTGIRGVRGISNESEIVVESEDQRGRPKGVRLQLLRPLLGVFRTEIEEYAGARSLKYREDTSNSDPSFLRNRVRNLLIPFLNETFTRDVRKALLRIAEVSVAEDAYVASAAEELYSSAISNKPVSRLPKRVNALNPSLKIDVLENSETALQRRVLHRWLSEFPISDVGFREIELARGLIDSTSDVAKVNLPGGHHARRKSGRLFVTAPENGSK